MQRKVNIDRLPILILLLVKSDTAIFDVARTEQRSIFATAGRESKKVEGQSSLGSDRMASLVLLKSHPMLRSQILARHKTSF